MAVLCQSIGILYDLFIWAAPKKVGHSIISFALKIDSSRNFLAEQKDAIPVPAAKSQFNFQNPCQNLIMFNLCCEFPSLKIL